MPRLSKNPTQQDVIDDAFVFLAFALLESDMGLEDIALAHYAQVASASYVDRPVRSRKKDNYFFSTKFYRYSTSEFRQNFRTDMSGFRFISSLIEGLPVFSNNSNLPQTHPSWQLAVALMRFGHYGSRAASNIIASDVGIGYGTVIDFTDRVINALVSISPDWISWPSMDERADHGRRMSKEGFPRCVGFIDGTTLPLFQKPIQEGSSYFDRKKRYSVNAQIICDMHGRIIALHTGCPGSAADSTVYQRMDQFQTPSEYFSAGEYLLADSAYGVTKNCIPSFKAPAADLPDNASFNFYLACSRVRNEHCIGVLKGWWQSLRELRHKIQDDSNMEHLCRWVLACCVLHNIMIYIRDEWKEEPEEEDKSGNTNHPHIVNESTATGINFRDTLMRTTLDINRMKRCSE